MNLKKEDLDKIKKLFEYWDNEINIKNEIKIEGNGMAWSHSLHQIIYQHLIHHGVI